MWNSPEAERDSSAPAHPTTAYVAPSGSKAPRSDAANASIGASVLIKGDLTADEDLMVDGRVEGRIDSPGHSLTVGPNAVVKGVVTAKVATVFGTVSGTVTVKDRLDVRSGAAIDGELTCGRLSIQEGALVNAKVTMARRATKPNGAAADVAVTAASV